MILVIVIVFAIVGWLVSYRLKSKFREYSQTPLQSGMSGAETAVQMLRDNGIYDVKVLCVDGELTDHYHPKHKTVNLSYDVYHGRNAAAVAVAAHECGHAVQHARAYSMLEFRSMMVPVQSVSAKVLNIITLLSFFGGLMFLGLPTQLVLLVIIACYSVITLFSVVTLPVELDASRRALAWIEERGVVNSSEYNMAKDALKWAALTYFVAALGSLVMLAYYVMQYLGLRRD
jgi:hypothetical protein